MESLKTLRLIEASVTLRSTASLARCVADLITSGKIPADSQLPTVRSAADHLGMSRSAVGQAWRELQVQGLVESRRRGGTVVLPVPRPPHAQRFESMIRASTGMRVNLGNLWCENLPAVDLHPGFEHALTHGDLDNPFAQPIQPEFQAAIAATWPFATDTFLAMHGAIDTLEMTLAALVRPGDHVIVETPTMARIFDILEALGANILPVKQLVDGPDLEAISHALIAKPVAFIYQPSRSLPSGRSVSEDWLKQAADILDGTLPILEFDQVWPLVPTPPSLGTHLPGQVVHVRSFNFSFGPSMRLAVVGGNSKVIQRLWNRLSYSSRYVSPIMQLAQGFLIQHEGAQRTLQARQSELDSRFERFTNALGIEDTVGHRGPMIWFPVPDEHSVCTRLGGKGIVVHPGAYFQAGPNISPHVAINTGAVGIEIEHLAAEIIETCRAPLTQAD